MSQSDGWRPKIALTAAILHEDPERLMFKGKALHFSEQKMGRAVWCGGGLPIQLFDLREREALEQVIAGCDGLLLQGGADVAPSNYGEQPLQPQWCGDPIRDRHELDAIEVALALRKPILGICRGVQILNVAFGGSLYQDIATQVAGSLVHRDWDHYEELEHDVRLEPGTWLAAALAELTRPIDDGSGATHLLTNSVHHQAIKDVGEPFTVCARSSDGVIEAIELIDEQRFVVGVQWHPEWLDGSDEGGAHRPSGSEVFRRFMQACRERAS